MIKDRVSLKNNIVSGFGTLIIREFFLKLLSFLGQIFLARLLIPSDFGTYVIIVFIVNFVALFTDVGLSLAIIQKKKDPGINELSSIFILKFTLSLIAVVLIFLFAPLLKYFYLSFSDENVFMLRVLSLIILTYSIRSIPTAILERNIRYNLISIIDVAGIGAYYVVSIIGAFMHLGAWSFIFGALAKESVETFLLYYVQPVNFVFKFSISSIKDMIKFGIYLQGNAFVNILQSSIIPVVGGKLNSIHAVGLLDFAYNIATIPEIIAHNFGRVAFAGYSRIQTEKELLFKSVSKSMASLAILLYIFPVIILGLGNEIIPLLFSSKWISAMPALYWYCISTLFLPIIAALGQAILVIGKSKEIFWSSFMTLVVALILAVVLMNRFGLVGIPITYLYILISFSIYYIFIFKRSGFMIPVVSIIMPKIVVGLLSLSLLHILNLVLPHTFLILVFKVMIGTIIYLLLMLLITKNDTLDLIKIILQWLKLKI